VGIALYRLRRERNGMLASALDLPRIQVVGGMKLVA
ncbi:hypothetical protein A2U01_0067014, partial [Trifolium medium]|nr:hypothetical protein [Trifolium medium]